MRGLLRHYWPELLITLLIWGFMGWKFGLSAFVLTIILSMLEITLSADNAVINSKVLMKLSRFWQAMFLTIGILIAVFGVRFALPIVMVSLATSLDLGTVFSLAINQPELYGEKLHSVAPVIYGFGGMFLLMVAIFFFLDTSRTAGSLWLKKIERVGMKLGTLRLSRVVAPLVVTVASVAVTPADLQVRVAVALLLGIGTFAGLHVITLLMERFGNQSGGQQVGWAAFSLFMYLQVLDASFSLDGVVGAFAITTNIIVIMAGLGVGALWVRTFTVYMVRHDTLVKYRFLDAGAHWAILSLATIMFLKLGGIELPEIVVGSIGLVFIAAAVYSSAKVNKSEKVLT